MISERKYILQPTDAPSSTISVYFFNFSYYNCILIEKDRYTKRKFEKTT